jgi:hypothetical protein
VAAAAAATTTTDLRSCAAVVDPSKAPLRALEEFLFFRFLLRIMCYQTRTMEKEEEA